MDNGQLTIVVSPVAIYSNKSAEPTPKLSIVNSFSNHVI